MNVNGRSVVEFDTGAQLEGPLGVVLVRLEGFHQVRLRLPGLVLDGEWVEDGAHDGMARHGALRRGGVPAVDGLRLQAEDERAAVDGFGDGLGRCDGSRWRRRQFAGRCRRGVGCSGRGIGRNGPCLRRRRWSIRRNSPCLRRRRRSIRRNGPCLRRRRRSIRRNGPCLRRRRRSIRRNSPCLRRRRWSIRRGRCAPGRTPVVPTAAGGKQQDDRGRDERSDATAGSDGSQGRRHNASPSVT